MTCGLLGRKLAHSYSPTIHSYFGEYAYQLCEKEPEELEDFLRNGDFLGLNVTIPYKQDVIAYLDTLSDVAKRLGAVNTIVRRDGKLIGHNTDYFGFQTMVKKSGLSPAGKKCLVLGSGGASRVAVDVLQECGAEVIVISRNGAHNYDDLSLHSDASIIVNTTPVGMYPNTGAAPVELDLFPHLEGVLDVVYNPARTQLLLEAEAHGVVAMNGLWMLVAQAKCAAEWFLNSPIPEQTIQKVHDALKFKMENIVLIGMPGCGKTTIGQIFAQETGKTFVDTDTEIEKLAHKSIPQIFAEDGENAFREWETEVLSEFGKQSGLVIATGGGCVTQARNYPLLHQNGVIFWLERSLDRLPTCGRPISLASNLDDLYEARKPLYQQFADYVVSNNGTAGETAKAILACLAGASADSQQ